MKKLRASIWCLFVLKSLLHMNVWRKEEEWQLCCANVADSWVFLYYKNRRWGWWCSGYVNNWSGVAIQSASCTLEIKCMRSLGSKWLERICMNWIWGGKGKMHVFVCKRKIRTKKIKYIWSKPSSYALFGE